MNQLCLLKFGTSRVPIIVKTHIPTDSHKNKKRGIMDNKLLISSSTEKTTKLKGLEKLLKQAAGDSTASVASVGEKAQGISTFAIVDGEKLLQNDSDEQEVLSNALEQQIPIVMENANKDITSALTGTGVDQEVVVLKP